MKLFKKLLMLGATLTACLGLSIFAVACGKNDGDSSSSTPSTWTGGAAGDSAPADYVYCVKVQNETGFGFRNVSVKLYDGDSVVAEARTNSAGDAYFTKEDVATPKTYAVKVENPPKGYQLPNVMPTTAPTTGTSTEVVIAPTGVIKETAPANTKYTLGSVMYDFTVTTVQDEVFTLSEVLKDKKLVLLNFWYINCGPCQSEFPYMHNAVSAYSDTVSMIGITTKSDDSKQAVKNYQETSAYSGPYPNFNMAVKGSGDDLESKFTFLGTPHTVLIDRYGVVVYEHTGSITSDRAFTMQFDKFVGEDYVPTVVGSASDDDGEDGGSSAIQIKPTVAAPDVADVKAALLSADDATQNANFTFRFTEKVDEPTDADEYNWPWVVNGSGADAYLSPSNANFHNSYSMLYATITAKKGDVLIFDYKIDTEADADIFYVFVNGAPVKDYSGLDTKNWNTAYAYVFEELEAGEATLTFAFIKDNDTSTNDIVQIKNLRIGTVSDLATVKDVSIFRYAAKGATDKQPAADSAHEDATHQVAHYNEYVTVTLNETDGYYHVGNENGPTLYANMLGVTLWNQTSLWELAYNGYVAGNGMNLLPALEDFAWEANQKTEVYGYTPVTEDLKILLDLAVQYTTYLEKWSGDYHANEWLELCVYWERYGANAAEQPKDPMECISFTAAKELTGGTSANPEGEANWVEIPYAINPRGFKYKFIPAESGVYKVYAKNHGDVYRDSQVFLMADDRTTQLGFWDNKVEVEMQKDAVTGKDTTDYHFEFYWYFEEGQTYYMLFTLFMDGEVAAPGVGYDVFIDFVDATSYTHKTNAAENVYSMNLTTSELFLPDAIDYEYYDDTDDGVDNGCYYQKRKNGERGGKIYLDVSRPTAFSSSSLLAICQDARDNVPDVTKRILYVDGVDYTEKPMTLDGVDYELGMYELCYLADQNQTLKGYIPVTKDVYNLLQTIMLSETYDGIEQSWLLWCSYDRTVSANVCERW